MNFGEGVDNHGIVHSTIKKKFKFDSRPVILIGKILENLNHSLLFIYSGFKEPPKIGLFKLFLNTGRPGVPEVGSFSNANIFALDQLISETKTGLKSSISPILH